MSIGAEVQQYPAVEATLGDFFDGIRPVVAHWIEYMTSYTTRPQLSELQLNQRRESLDLHALIAQVSLAVVIVLFGTWTWTIYVAKRYLVREVESRPSSPQLKWRVVRRRNGWLQKISTTAAYVKWILGNEVSVQHVGQLGTLGQIIFGVLWLAWLLVLCYRKTAPDYFHLTKRFGIVAASQLPLHYLMAVKSRFSPIQIITRRSHEELNRAHRTLGLIIWVLMVHHACLYLFGFFLLGSLKKRIVDIDVVLGMTAFTHITVLVISASVFVRRIAYRVFFQVHTIVAIVIIPVLFMHSKHIRPFLYQTIAVYLFSSISRFFNATKHHATLELLPESSVIGISFPTMPSSRSWTPGQHLYLWAPRRIGGYLHSNPFTVASLPGEDGQVTLILRVRKGNTHTLRRIIEDCTIPCSQISRPEYIARSLKLEGPYGASRRLPSFFTFDRILFIAGGIGATYTLPLFRNFQACQNARKSKFPIRTEARFVWAAQSLEHTTWALLFFKDTRTLDTRAAAHERELYITRHVGARAAETVDGDIELVERRRYANDSGSSGAVAASLEVQQHSNVDSAPGSPVATSSASVPPDHSPAEIWTDAGFAVRYGRPRVREILDETFAGNVKNVGVFVCGPWEMGREVRKEVGKWIRKGRKVYLHEEMFGHGD